jgi:biopolymer transport protein TolQ
MSVVTWGIVFSKGFAVRNAKRQSKKFDDVFWTSKNLAQIHDVAKKLNVSPLAKVYLAGHQELNTILNAAERDGDQKVSPGDLEYIDRALKKAKAEEITRLEKGTTFLATTASAAPFIGLFGTVWGIMNAFIGLSQVKTSSIQAVAPGISEALIATAIGLAAAIPAAIFYNIFMQQVRVLARGIDAFCAEFLNITRRHFLK